MTKRFKYEYYRSTKRHDSFFKEVDLRTEKSSTYTAIRMLGGGAYGYARLFSNGEHQVVVKSSGGEMCLNNEEVEKQKNSIKREYDLTRTAYPDDHYSLSFYIDETAPEETVVDYRFVMPLVEGQTLTTYLHKPFDYNDLAKIFLRIAQELTRIHRLGIIHGDPNPDNIFIIKKNNDYHVRFIDFGVSHHMSEPANDFLGLPQGPLSAPERHQAEPIPANRRQDVYSLAKLFSWIINHYFLYDFLGTPLDKHPSIGRFISKGTHIKPSERQRLTTFISSVSMEILSYDIPESIKPVCTALFDGQKESLKKRLSRLTNESTNDILELLYGLIKHHCYQEVRTLLAATENILRHSRHRLTKLIEQIVKERDFPIELLREMVAVYIPRNKLAAILINPISDQKSMLHLTIEHKRIDILIVFIHVLSKTAQSAIWDDGWELEKISIMRQEDQKTMLELALYIHMLHEEYNDQPNKQANRLFASQSSMSQECLACHIKITGYLTLFIEPGEAPFERMLFMDDFTDLMKHCKLSGKEYVDKSLVDLFRRMKDSAHYLEEKKRDCNIM